MRADLTVEQRQLAELIIDISERCYAASWMQHVEYVLWESLSKGERTYGHGLITAQDISALKDFAGRSNAWIFFDDRREETAIDLSSWQQKFETETQRMPSILGG